MTSAKGNCAVKQKQVNLLANKCKRLQNSPDEISKPNQRRIAMSSVDREYYEYLMSQDKSTLAIKIMNLETSSSNNRIAESIKENAQLKQQLHDLPKKIVEDITNELSNNTSLYFEIRESTSEHCPNKEYEWFNYVRFRNYINTILKKYGEENE